MNCCQGEPRLRDALADPIIQAMMVADGVDRDALESSLRETASNMAQRSAKRAESDSTH
jgi:hypothetical protein